MKLLGALTTRGRAFVATGITVVVGGVLLGLDTLVRIGVLALALPLVAIAAVAYGRSTVRASRSVTPPRTVAGSPVEVTLDLEGAGRAATGSLLVEDQLPDQLGRTRRAAVVVPTSRWQTEVRYTAVPRLRGYYTLGPLSVEVGDPFGFLTVARRFPATTPLVVTPAVVPLGRDRAAGAGAERGDEQVRRGATGRTDDATVREYHRGDDLRRIHWRTTARTGELMVRREEEGRQADLTLFLDDRRGAHRAGATGTFEWAVSAVASIATHYAAMGWPVRLVTGSTTAPDEVPDEIGVILDRLAAVTVSANRAQATVPAELLATRGTLVAVVGADTDLVDDLDRASVTAGRRVALVLDAADWSATAPPEGGAAADAAAHARARGFAATVVGGRDTVAEAWDRATVQQATRAVR